MSTKYLQLLGSDFTNHEHENLNLYDTVSGTETIDINAAEPQCPLEVTLTSETYTDFSNITVALTNGENGQSIVSGADGVVVGLSSEPEFKLVLSSTEADFDPTLVTITCKYKLDVGHVLHDYVLHVDMDGDGGSGSGGGETGELSVMVDKTLSISGAAADAKAVGDAISSINNEIAELADVAKSGDYNDLINKPTIPSVEGFATKDYVDDSVANKITSPTSADVGQALIVKTVDENGTPIEWETANVSTGSGNETNIKVDTSLTVAGAAADAKVTGDEINNLKTEKVPNTRTINGKQLTGDIVLTAEDIGVVNIETDTTLKTEGMAADAKATGDAIDEINSKLEDIEDNIYIQNDEPVDAPENSIWIDLDDEGLSNTPENAVTNIYVVDAATTDITTVDFSAYAIGDVVLVTTS